MSPRWLLLTCVCMLLQWNANASSKKDLLEAVFEWKYLDYDFGTEKERETAIQSGEYNYKNVFPIDVDKWKNLTFVTAIRDKGVPSSLNVVTDKLGAGGYLLKPYPDWSWAKLGSCDSITSVYRVAIDKCDRLWVLDTGVVGNDRVCGAQLLTFDLNTSKLLKRIKIPKDIAVNATINKGLLVTPVLDVRGDRCEETIVYIADPDGYALIYYDDKSHLFKRLTSDAFNYDPKHTKYTIAGESFTLEDGIVGMALSKNTGKLYFSPMSSYLVGEVLTRQLTQSKGNDLIVAWSNDIVDTQLSAKAISKDGILFYGRVGDTSIGCWNENKRKSKRCNAIVAQDPMTLQFASGMKIKEGHCEELWVLTNKYQKIMDGTFDFNEVNFRVLKGEVKKLVQGTVCERSWILPKRPIPWLGIGPVLPFCDIGVIYDR